MAKKYIVLCQEYIESESGWGQRPDGAAIAISKEALEEYTKKHWELLKKTIWQSNST